MLLKIFPAFVRKSMPETDVASKCEAHLPPYSTWVRVWYLPWQWRHHRWDMGTWFHLRHCSASETSLQVSQ